MTATGKSLSPIETSTSEEEVGHRDALIIVDVQKDFLSGGALAVSDANKVIPPLNRYISEFRKGNRPIFFTRGRSRAANG